MANPVFSIITPTCGRPELLRRNIQSVINQNFGDFEHIIVDDEMDSLTADIIKEFKDERIIFLRHDSRKGAAASYNTGVKASRGEFILFLDDDDEYLPQFLEKMYSNFTEASPETGFIWTGVMKVLDDIYGEKIIGSRIWPARFTTKEEGFVAATTIGNGYGVCVRKRCIDQIGLYDESLVVCEDTDFLFRLAEVFEFGTIPDILVRIHQHNQSQLTSDNNYLIRLKGKEKILERYRDFIGQYPELFYIHTKSYADLCYKFNFRRKGLSIMWSLIKKEPFRFINYPDIVFYEMTGADSKTCYAHSGLRKLTAFVKRLFSGSPEIN
jgi:glycosyltransferase involved in cell wall biosynthesis